MNTNNLLRATAGLAFLLLFAFPAHSAVARAVSFDEKVTGAESIIFGKCTATRAGWDPSGRWILTYSTFQVEKALKGAAVPEVTVVTPGGQVGSIHQETAGVPQFETGSQNVLFLKRGEIGPTVLFLDQGAYEVESDERGELTVEPVASSLVLMDTQTGRASGGEPARSLRRFEQDVQSALARADRGRRQQYGVAPAEKPAAKSARAGIAAFFRQHRLSVGLLLAAIAISTFLFIRGR